MLGGAVALGGELLAQAEHGRALGKLLRMPAHELVERGDHHLGVARSGQPAGHAPQDRPVTGHRLLTQAVPAEQGRDHHPVSVGDL